MLLNSGTPSLVEVTRFYVDDPTTAARTQYTTTETLTAINLGYLDTVNIIMEASPGYFVTRTFNNTTVNLETIALPATFTRMVQVVVEESGKNLSSDSTASATQYNHVSWNQLQAEKLAGTNARIWSMSPSTSSTGKVEIYPKVAVAGTSASWFTFEFEPTALAADSDSPLFPANHHEVVAVKAAIFLKTSRDLDIRLLQTRENDLERRLKANIGTWDIGTTAQFSSAALASKYEHASLVGQVK